MKFRYFKDYNRLSKTAASIVKQELIQNPEMLMCTATGNSPLGLYKEMFEVFKNNKSLFDKIRIIKLDEWLNVPVIDPGSCEYYLNKYLLSPLSIPGDRYFSFNSMTEDPEKECSRMQKVLGEEGPIDLCVLGVGINGHLGFNEPALYLTQHCHVAKLTETSKDHSMVKNRKDKPSFGLTLGIKDIMSSTKILLIISGNKKENVKKSLYSGKISNDCPASILWLHNNVDCLVIE